ncbi:hypothetical protein [Paracoccus rhizosphaerae]|uniref:Uncharacterized protein n=1 Tax=Paracoccus rhizosphaerae TaxID=1133347 RepID=A0ABV6CN02_9RHOB|nr:hypothetical protein [Paracoccus rhizosphaerae]
MTPSGLPEDFDALLLLIGRLTYSWTNTESLLIHLIAGLARVDKETALVIFLTLNTTRARVDLVERLAKLDQVPAQHRTRILDLTREFMGLSVLRNRYSHSIYAFDMESGSARTILMRISDRKYKIKMGLSTDLDEDARRDMEAALTSLAALNQKLWSLIHELGYPT